MPKQQRTGTSGRRSASSASTSRGGAQGRGASREANSSRGGQSRGASREAVSSRGGFERVRGGSGRRDAERGRKGAVQGRGSVVAHGRGSRGTSRQDSGDTSVYIEGRRAVVEALELAVPLKRALVMTGSEELAPLIARLEERGVPIEPTPRARLDMLSSHGAHQGIVVQTAPFSYASLGDIIAANTSATSLVIVLDHVTDEGNFGAIVRSAEVVGATGVVVANARAARVGTGAYKTSAGAVLHLPIAQVPNIARAVEELKDAGYWVVAASEHADETLYAAPLKGRIAVVMGSEGSGVSPLVLKTCDDVRSLPQRGRVESLNVAQAATVFAYEWLRVNASELA